MGCSITAAFAMVFIQKGAGPLVVITGPRDTASVFDVSTRRTRKATAREAAYLRSAPDESLHGGYRLGQVDDQTAVFELGGAKVFDQLMAAKALLKPPLQDQLGEDRVEIVGWVGPGPYVSVRARDGSASIGFNTVGRAVVRMPEGRVVPYSGWIARSGKIGIVPGEEGIVMYTETYHSQGHHGDNSPSWHRVVSAKNRPVCFYIVKPPRDLGQFRLASAPKRLISYNGRPLQTGLPYDIDFSKDGRWAILESYLIDTQTGRATKLAGYNAAFLP